ETTTLQIVTGSYERVLHGFTATIPQTALQGTGPAHDTPKESPLSFTDTFLFAAHTSSIRCLALSPPPPSDPNGRLLLATGGTDERINIYSLSLCPPPPSKSTSTSSTAKLPLLPPTLLLNPSVSENAKNKELGSLLHHTGPITTLSFPTRTKLLSSSSDSTIAITRTRDWEPLSVIRAPVPKPQGRPSGDTAAPGEVPSGINDFAVHPSNKLMLSVSKGEKCMRLWNLVTGKKAGVLQFGREVLGAAGEGRFASGEGRKVVWDPAGEEFAAGFERGVVVFGIDCRVRGAVVPVPRTKVCQMRYLPGTAAAGSILVVSTEDGRVMFYNTGVHDDLPTTQNTPGKEDTAAKPCKLIAQLGGPAAGISGRIKDFEILPIPQSTGSTDAHANNVEPAYLVVTGSSDGSVRFWYVSAEEVKGSEQQQQAGKDFTANQVGRLIGTYSTGTRITCLKAFVMTGKAEEAVDED
ncbi:WD40 repeat-like protein, partial [Westerdykella ornata]